jgi:hypothetical protein
MDTQENAPPVAQPRLVRPPVVCLCGSTKFKTEFEIANREATMSGAIVVAPGVFGHADGIALTEEEKTALDALHFKKIDMADVVWVIAPGGYIGESTSREIEYAGRCGKPVVVRRANKSDG